MRVKTLVVLGAVIASLLPIGPALAGGSHGSGAGPSKRALPSPPPKGLVKVWSGLLAARDAIAASIDGKRPDRISAEAVIVRGLAQSVMGEVGDISDSRRSRVKSGATQLSNVAGHLQSVAVAGDPAVLNGDLKRIDRALRLIRSQYPEGSLRVEAQSSAAHASGHSH